LRRVIEDLFESDIRKLNEQRQRQGAGPLDIFEYPLTRRNDRTLRDYIDNMVLPRHARRFHVDQDQAMNVRTSFEHADTNFGRLQHKLIVVEWRNLGKGDQTIDEIEALFKIVADFARKAYDNKTKLRMNERTAEGREYFRALTEAIGSLGRRPRGIDLISQVRDLLDSATTSSFESLREPVTRGEVTTNLIADTVLALNAFDRKGDSQTGLLRQAIEALKSQVTATVKPSSPFYADAGRFINEADDLIRALQHRELNHLRV
jgi:hypothetical protein